MGASDEQLAIRKIARAIWRRSAGDGQLKDLIAEAEGGNEEAAKSLLLAIRNRLASSILPPKNDSRFAGLDRQALDPELSAYLARSLTEFLEGGQKIEHALHLQSGRRSGELNTLDKRALAMGLFELMEDTRELHGQSATIESIIRAAVKDPASMLSRITGPWHKVGRPITESDLWDAWTLHNARLYAQAEEAQAVAIFLVEQHGTDVANHL